MGLVVGTWLVLGGTHWTVALWPFLFAGAVLWIVTFGWRRP